MDVYNLIKSFLGKKVSSSLWKMLKWCVIPFVASFFMLPVLLLVFIIFLCVGCIPRDVGTFIALSCVPFVAVLILFIALFVALRFSTPLAKEFLKYEIDRKQAECQESDVYKK